MADLIAAGRLQLGVSRGSPESVIRGFESFGYYPAEGENEGDMARRHLDIFLKAIEGEGMAPSARVAGKYAPIRRSRRVCVSASGGVQAPIAPPCGPRRRA